MGTTALGVMRGTGAHHALLDLTLQTCVGLSQLVCLRPQLGNFVLLDVRARVSSAAGSEEAGHQCLTRVRKDRMRQQNENVHCPCGIRQRDGKRSI